MNEGVLGRRKIEPPSKRPEKTLTGPERTCDSLYQHVKGILMKRVSYGWNFLDPDSPEYS